MQAAGMLCGTRAVYLLAFLIFLIGNAHSYPLQFLPSIPGYIPVYIRHGDEPLEDINPQLAEAFHEKSGLSKSIRLNLPESAGIDSKEYDADTLFDKSNKKKGYSIHVRDVGNNPASSEEGKETKKPGEHKRSTEIPKLLSIYELPGDRDVTKEEHNESARSEPISKGPVIKVSPLSDEEKDELEKLTIQIETEKSKPELQAGAPRSRDNVPSDPPVLKTEQIQVEKEESESNDVPISTAELPAEASHRGNNVPNSPPVLKVEQIITDESSVEPNLYLVKDLSQLTVKQDTPVAEKEKSAEKEHSGNNNSAGPVKDNEPPIKEARPVNVLSNVDKIAPIPAESINSQSSATKEIVDSREDDKRKDLTERNDDVTTS